MGPLRLYFNPWLVGDGELDVNSDFIDRLDIVHSICRSMNDCAEDLQYTRSNTEDVFAEINCTFIYQFDGFLGLQTSAAIDQISRPRAHNGKAFKSSPA